MIYSDIYRDKTIINTIEDNINVLIIIVLNVDISEKF